jgi:hypothetical protein
LQAPHATPLPKLAKECNFENTNKLIIASKTVI